ncbi:sugar phosphate isomerase/epimerase family protein [Roseimaritima ulvae]|uniref:Xylose isomerase-like TIM barrel n=1 Tax=Roseimaritima ulvae TaxID=980254 RepID=A0A5B9QLG6_9BACT|nr:sugar phosphate isomerase/epimerase family protein [Roseimaritima ulvae]QEG39868.1 Xylose isomerase-like TIM barrel [Roseimaritima ulvae]
MLTPSISRRQFCAIGAAAAAAGSLQPSTVSAEDASSFQLKYLLGSCMYGYQYVGEIFPEVRKTGATAIDIWPKVHGNQREQLADLGEQKFAAMMAEHDITLGCITQYKLGPFGLQDEMRVANRLGCQTMVTGGKGPVGLKGQELKSAVAAFIEKMKPHLAVAEQMGVTIAIENHANNLIDSADSLKWLAELSPSKHLGIALAPYHLPQDEQLLSDLINTLGDSIAVFYAWQHGMGCHKKLPKQQELLQMPGRGDLNFGPLVSALKQINYKGWTEIFMHPVPRGVPILETAAEVTAEINRSRRYLDAML